MDMTLLLLCFDSPSGTFAPKSIITKSNGETSIVQKLDCGLACKRCWPLKYSTWCGRAVLTEIFDVCSNKNNLLGIRGQMHTPELWKPWPHYFIFVLRWGFSATPDKTAKGTSDLLYTHLTQHTRKTEIRQCHTVAAFVLVLQKSLTKILNTEIQL